MGIFYSKLANLNKIFKKLSGFSKPFTKLTNENYVSEIPGKVSSDEEIAGTNEILRELSLKTSKNFQIALM